MQGVMPCRDSILRVLSPFYPLIPHHHSSRRQVFWRPISTSEVTALPLRRWSHREPPLLSQAIGSLLVTPPLAR